MAKSPSKKHSFKKTWTPLRTIRIICAAIVLTLFTLTFVNPWGILPEKIGHFLATIQIVPAISSLLAGVGIVALIILIAHTIITLLFGRIYCSFLCPLGIFQDVITRIGNVFRKKTKARLSKALNILRYSILGICILSFIAGVQGYIMMWLDPYSEYGRIMNTIVRPLVVESNNLVSSVNPEVARINPQWAEPGIVYVPIILFLILLLSLALWRGRLYCNSICPVGSLLGLLSKHSLYKMTFDKDACVRCGNCLKACKAECIDLKKGEIDGSRCVACFNCASACNEKGIHFRPTWGKKKESTPPKPCPKKALTPPSKPADSTETKAPYSPLDDIPQMRRRAFIGTTLAGVWTTMTSCQKHTNESMRKGDPKDIPVISPAITPAGSRSVGHFLDYCTACHLCVEACPTKCLRPAFMEYGVKGFLKPHLTFEDALCIYECTACASACPVGAIQHITEEEKKEIRIGLAKFDINHCIVTKDKKDCGACSEHCPTKALEMVPIGEQLQQPVWHEDHCTLCESCVEVCPAKALTEKDDKIIVNYDLCIGCKKCLNECEAGALSLRPAQFEVRIPKLIDELCIGCGGCEFACPEKAIMITGLSVHEKAEILVQEQVTNPNEGVDFPF